MSDPPRYLPDEPLPETAYLPGRTARPADAGPRRSLPADRWREDDAYLRGVDLYNAGFAWEAHEAWEAAWRESSGAQRELLSGLIQCAAVCVKIASGDVDAAQRITERAERHLRAAGASMGVDGPALASSLIAWTEGRPTDLDARPRLALPLRRVLSTERMNVRELAAEDLDALARLCADPLVMRFVGDGKPLDRQRVELWIARSITSYREHPHGFGTWAVCARDDGALIGYAGVVYPEGEPELIYTLDQAHWGRGLGTELAKAVLAHALVHVPTVVATVDTHHEPSRRILARLGFVQQRTGVDEHGLPTEWWSITRP